MGNIDISYMLMSNLIALAVGGLGMYIGFIHNLRIKVAVLEQKVEKVDARLEKKSSQFDEIQKDLTDIKVSLARVVESLGIIKKSI